MKNGVLLDREWLDELINSLYLGALANKARQLEQKIKEAPKQAVIIEDGKLKLITKE